MVTITERAARRIKEILAEDSRQLLRLAVQGGGCSGFQYNLVLEEAPSDNDEVVECGDIKVILDPISKRYVQGSEIDFDDTSLGGGFKINNPNAKSTCGCGQSFQA